MEASAQNDQRVMSIVGIAMRQSPGSRHAYLRLACENDSELYREVLEIVKGEERMGGFLLEPIIAREAPVKTFEPGQVICDRFEVIREIGQGGMGIVYEAFDQKRKQRIAIKSAKAGFQRLLTPELEHALSVRHPNVCRVNEIHTAQTDHGSIDFLTMELLEGETLSEHIHKRGKITGNEALTIARQLCAGLAEAHRSGVLHRDLKSANIILCKDRDENLRAVITDFGLAHGAGDSLEIGGTPGYLAPEIWRGKPASKASDIYALGVVLYEMVTGRRPFEDDIAESHLTYNRMALGSAGATLDSRWGRIILPCLDPSPKRRPLDPGGKLTGFDRSRWRTGVAFISVPLVLLTSLALPTVRESIWPPQNVRLAVLPPSASPEWSAAANGWIEDVTDRIQHMRTGRRTIAVIPPEKLRELQVQTPEQAKEGLHATHVLESSVRGSGDAFTTDLSLIDLNTKVHLGDFSGHYSHATRAKVPLAMAEEVAYAFHLRSPDGAADSIAPSAVEAYDQALSLVRSSDDNYEEAIHLFQEASSLDASSALPWAGLAQAQVSKYLTTKQRDVLDDARTSLKVAESLAPDSARVHLVAGLLHRTAGLYDRALDDYRRALELEPHNAETLLRMAAVYDFLDDPERALETFQKAIRLEPDYYEPYYELGIFHYYRGKYPDAIRQFREAIRRAPRLYEAYTDLGAALNYIGRDSEAEEALRTSLGIKETARALNSLGAIQAYRGRDQEAVTFYERAISISTRNYIYLLNLGDADRRLRRLTDAKVAYQKGMKLALGELNDDPRAGLTRAYVAYFAARLGDRKRAEQEIEQSLQLSPGDTMVQRKAVLTYVALGQSGRAMDTLRGAAPDVLQELARHPDLTAFCRNPSFKGLLTFAKGGK